MLFHFRLAEYIKHFLLRWRVKDVVLGEFLSLRVFRVANSLRRFREIVRRPPELNIGSEQEPMRAWFSKRHPHTASIDDSNPSDHSVELHMSMTTNNDRCIDSFKDR